MFELITSAYPNRTSVSELIAWGRSRVNCPAQNPDAQFDSRPGRQPGHVPGRQLRSRRDSDPGLVVFNTDSFIRPCPGPDARRSNIWHWPRAQCHRHKHKVSHKVYKRCIENTSNVDHVLGRFVRIPSDSVPARNIITRFRPKKETRTKNHRVRRPFEISHCLSPLCGRCSDPHAARRGGRISAPRHRSELTAN